MRLIGHDIKFGAASHDVHIKARHPRGHDLDLHIGRVRQSPGSVQRPGSTADAQHRVQFN